MIAKISDREIERIASANYALKGKITQLPGEIDLNYKITTAQNKSYILKISPPDVENQYLDFQSKLYKYIQNKTLDFQYPMQIANSIGKIFSFFIDENGDQRNVRLLTWIEGRVWSKVNPITSELRIGLGIKCGELTNAFQRFYHPFAQRTFDWDLANASWTFDFLDLFIGEEKALIHYFQKQFEEIQPRYKQLRKSLIHNDPNDNNILVDNDLAKPKVIAIIDYGDAVYSQVINDLAVAIAYGIMDVNNPLEAAKEIIFGYHSKFALKEDDLTCLYTLVAMRLVISLTKSTLNKQLEPNNVYLQISEKQAWELLKKWRNINSNFAFYSFRYCCGMEAHPNYRMFIEFSKKIKIDIKSVFKNVKNLTCEAIDLSMSSLVLGNYQDFKYSEVFNQKMTQQYSNFPEKIWVGGYGEARPIYTSDAFITNSNEGFEHRTIHLGIDFWAKCKTQVFSPLKGEIVVCHNNDSEKNYGPTLILKHTLDEYQSFFTLYGHLSKESLRNKKIGQIIEKGELLCEFGEQKENGNWAPHLHFQIILDRLEESFDFDGVSTPSNWSIFSSICPDPNLLFKMEEINKIEKFDWDNLKEFRKSILGKSLSLSYDKPLKIVRGEGPYLFDNLGQRFLDTVNNVAHVGHENSKVVLAGQKQMAVLNTNTRYLHAEIVNYAKELLATFPPELSVVHFVNSGSEANELALRMAKTATNQKDILALDWGYHGNTQGCIDLSAYKFNRKGGSGKPEYTTLVPLPDAFKGKYRGEAAGQKYGEEVLFCLQNVEKKGRKVAAFIAESIVSCGGQIELPKDFLKIAYEHVRQAGGLCIADEVQVGFGRVGKAFWGFQMHDVVPDIVTLGKPIGNGHPLAAVVCTRAVADAFANGMEFFNTFGGNPVSCAIGRAVLKEIQDHNLQMNALEIGNYLKQELKQMQIKFPILADVRGSGLFLGLELLEEDLKPATKKTNYLANRMKVKGILMSVDGPDNNVLKIKPPLVFDKSNAEFLLKNLQQVLKEDFMKF